MLTLSQNPPMLSTCASSLVELQGEWWVGHTKSRFEKTFAQQLLARGVDSSEKHHPKVKASLRVIETLRGKLGPVPQGALSPESLYGER